MINDLQAYRGKDISGNSNRDISELSGIATRLIK